VLVITGKGGSPLDRGFDRDDGSERGVLRRNVPRWLAEPDISPLIVSFTTAAQRHGGDGALYLHLRGQRG
jgi:DNA-nicking Smr family endonuclease